MAGETDEYGTNRKFSASLLDRLIDDNPHGAAEKPPLRVFSRGEFARKLIRDIGWLLNTRITERFDVGEEVGPRTVLDFGVDDWSHLSPANYEHRDLLAANVQEAMMAFEPRLAINRVEADLVPGRGQTLRLRFDAMIVADGAREPVSFDLVVDRSTGTVSFDGVDS